MASDQAGQRMQRVQGEQAPQTPSRDKFSLDQLKYVDAAAAGHAAAARDPLFNGADAERRYQGG